MSKKSKKFRGQRKKRIIGCGCFICMGFDKNGINNIKEKEIDKQMKNDLENNL